MASNGVNMNIGVTGIAQFKQNINTAKQQIKTMNADLALIEKQFKASGDAETYMQQKTELLKAKMEEQKKVLHEAEEALQALKDKGVTAASTAFQEMQRQIIAAKGDLLDTEQQLLNVGEAGEEAGDGVDEMNAQLARIGNGVSWQNVTDGLEKITAGMGKVIRKAWDVGKAIVDATLGAGQWADELQTTADQYGMPPEKLYRMRQVADIIDTDVDTIITAQDKLAKNNSQKGKEFMGALAELGVDPKGKQNIDLMWEAGEAIAAMTESAEEGKDQTYYATQIFGKSWRELLPLFKAGREAYEEAFGQTSWIGDENLEALTKLDDASNSLNNEWETLQKTFLGTLSGPMTDVMEILTDVLKEFNEYLQTEEGKTALKEMGDTVKQLIQDLVKINPDEVAQGLKKVIGDITDAFKWIKEHHEEVKTGLSVIAGGFALIKVGTLASNITRIVDGFRTLWNGANRKLPGMPKGPGTPAPSPTGDTQITNMDVVKAKIAQHLPGITDGAVSMATNAAAYGDWFTYQTSLGRSLSNWWNKMWGKEEQFADEDPLQDVKNIGENAKEWWGDYKHVLWNQQQYFAMINDQLKAAEEYAQQAKEAEEAALATPTKSEPDRENWVYGDDWTMEEILADIQRMEQEATDSSGEGANKVKDAGDEIKDAATNMKKLPGETAQAVRAALNGTQIVMDSGTLMSVVGYLLATGVENA